MLGCEHQMVPPPLRLVFTLMVDLESRLWIMLQAHAPPSEHQLQASHRRSQFTITVNCTGVRLISHQRHQPKETLFDHNGNTTKQRLTKRMQAAARMASVM